MRTPRVPIERDKYNGCYRSVLACSRRPAVQAHDLYCTALVLQRCRPAERELDRSDPQPCFGLPEPSAMRAHTNSYAALGFPLRAATSYPFAGTGKVVDWRWRGRNRQALHSIRRVPWRGRILGEHYKKDSRSCPGGCQAAHRIRSNKWRSRRGKAPRTNVRSNKKSLPVNKRRTAHRHRATRPSRRYIYIYIYKEPKFQSVLFSSVSSVCSCSRSLIRRLFTFANPCNVCRRVKNKIKNILGFLM